MSEEINLQGKWKQHKWRLIFKGEICFARFYLERSSHTAKGDGWLLLLGSFFYFFLSFVDILKVRLHTNQWRKSIIHHLQMLLNNSLVSPTCSVGLWKKWTSVTSNLLPNEFTRSWKGLSAAEDSESEPISRHTWELTLPGINRTGRNTVLRLQHLQQQVQL